MVGEDTSANLAEAFLNFRRARSEVLPAEMFGEPAWEVLLELFIADAHGRRITAREIAQRANVMPKVLSRWLIYLTNVGLIVGDGTGDLDDPLTLSAGGIEKVEQSLRYASELKHHIN